jgi:hypothetical protein
MIYNRNRKRKKAEKNKGKKRRTQIQMSAIEGQSSRVPNYILRSSSSSPQGEIESEGTAVLVDNDFTPQNQCLFGNDE